MGNPDAVIRIVPELRAVHVERQRSGVPAEVLYFRAKYDLADEPLASVFVRVSRLGALRRLVTTSATRLEIFEPLWIRLWPTHLLLVAAFRLAGLARRRRHEIGTYAMENSSLATLVGGDRSPSRILVAAIGLLIGLTARLTLTRIAFASDASAAVYRLLPFVGRIPSRVGLELPAPTAAESITEPVEPQSAVFLGVLEERKGVQQLVDAWEVVEKRLPSARVTVIGSGPLVETVAAWAARSPQTRRALGALPRDSATDVVGHSSVLVAPSIPDGRWREQIGLPIKEGLARGLTVVTTDQTGLACWLHDHGHRVVAVEGPAPLAGRLADELTSALSAPLDRDAVRASLPRRDGRLDADDWLNG